MSETLHRLADAVGIEAQYWDIHGTLHDTADETMRALLTALGWPADDEEQTADSLHRLLAREWGRLTPPVAVLKVWDVPSVAVVSDGAGTLSWTLRMECGAVHVGSARIEDLDVVAQGPDGLVRRRLPLPMLAAGYHDLDVEAGERHGHTRLIVSPGRGFLPAEFATRKLYGVSAQLYALASGSDWGVGDFSSLRLAIDGLAALGADVVGLNPLHALFLDTPADASPYCPSSRLFKNPLNIDVTAVPEFATVPAARDFLARADVAARIASARSGPFVDYPAVAALKREALEILYRAFCAEGAGSRHDRFAAFVAAGGTNLTRFATFQALSEHFATHDWSRWPVAFHDPDSAQTIALSRHYANRIAYFEYLQWLCEEQFSAAADAASARGMRVGLYNDLAVSVNTASADYWSHQDLFAGAVRIGSPPDSFNEAGQEWGVIPMRPLQMRESAYAHTIALLRANMRHAGALRIDHVMGLARLFLIPAGKTPKEGAYVRYPADDLFAIVALESARNRALVIGEDLGTVPDGFRDRMEAAGMLSCKVFYFERQGDGFRRPEDYPPLAAASVATHDLSTLRGYLDGTDIVSRNAAGMFSSLEEEDNARSARGWEKRQLFYALRDAGLLPDGIDPENREQGWTPALAKAIQTYVARAGSKLMLVQMDDLLGVAHQTNLPGTTWQHPNWCRRHPTTLEETFAGSDGLETLRGVAAERSR